MKKSYSIKRLTGIILALIMTVSLCIPFANVAYAAEQPISVETQENEIMPRAYHTFYKFPEGTFTSNQQYSFTVDKSCPLKVMWGGKYTDGSTGTMKIMISHDGLSSFYSYYVPIDGDVHAISLDRFPVAAGKRYTVILHPDDLYTSYVSVGEIYSLSY